MVAALRPSPVSAHSDEHDLRRQPGDRPQFVAGTGGTAVGGAIEAELFATTTLTNVTVVDNEAIGGSGGLVAEAVPASGGGLYNGVDSTAAVTDSTFSGNLAQGGSGGSMPLVRKAGVAA